MRKVVQYSLSGKKLGEYKNSIDAEKQTGISRFRINGVCRGIRKTTGGFRWQFKDEQVVYYMPDDMVARPCGNTIAEASRFLGVSEDVIRKSIKKNRPSGTGIIFKIEEV